MHTTKEKFKDFWDSMIPHSSTCQNRYLQTDSLGIKLIPDYPRVKRG